jgi:acyl-CoA synthetase (NDP forming)
MKIIEQAIKKGQKSLSEYDSKRMLKSYGFPVVREKLVDSRAAAVKAAKEIGLPVVLKACSADIAHKTEKKLIEVDLRTLKEVERAYQGIVKRVGNAPLDGILVQQMIKGSRELVIGMIRDAQFGPCVMFGLGGIFTEILKGCPGNGPRDQGIPDSGGLPGNARRGYGASLRHADQRRKAGIGK